MQMSFYRDWIDIEDVYHCSVLTSGNNESLCVRPGPLLPPAGIPLTSQAGSRSSARPVLLVAQ